MTSSNARAVRGRRIGVLGGTFDPVHIGHLVVADNALQQLDLDMVLFAPAGHPPHKPDRVISSATDRKAMIEIAIADREEFTLSDTDLYRKGPSFTVELLHRIDETYAPAALYFVMGADSLRDFATWSRPAAILDIARIAVARRPGVEIDDDVLTSVAGMPDRLHLLDSPLNHISSTDLRDRVSRGQTIRYLLPQEVHDYIDARHLYRTERIILA